MWIFRVLIENYFWNFINDLHEHVPSDSVCDNNDHEAGGGIDDDCNDNGIDDDCNDSGGFDDDNNDSDGNGDDQHTLHL